jgi:glycosyltransferase involved in cell wall biosynthesis
MKDPVLRQDRLSGQSPAKPALMKKILMISYYYPPLADVGALRALGFSRYLPEYGWEPYVLSVKNPDKHSCIPGKDKAPDGVKVHYTRSIMHLSWISGKINGLASRILKLFGARLTNSAIRDLICMPDEYIGWIPLTVLKGLSLIRKEKIDVIYVTCKPFSSALIGALLKSLTGKPLVLDFRDPVFPDYALSPNEYYRTFPTFRLIGRIEEKVLRRADKLLLTTEDTRELYHSFFPFMKNRTAVIYNGFFEELVPNTETPFEKFTIVYSGNFYSALIPPDPFFKAMQALLQKKPEMKDRMEFVYIGSREPWLETMTDRYGLQDVVRIVGRVSRPQSIAYIGNASLLLIRIVQGKISTKLFEGLAAGVPLLALVHQGEVARIIQKYSLSSYYIVTPDNAADIESALLDGYEKWKTGRLARGKNRQFYDDFNKKKLTSDCASVINTLVQEKSRTPKQEVPEILSR